MSWLERNNQFNKKWQLHIELSILLHAGGLEGYYQGQQIIIIIIIIKKIHRGLGLKFMRRKVVPGLRGTLTPSQLYCASIWKKKREPGYDELPLSRD